MRNVLQQESFNSLYEYILDQDFTGYDPYDTLNSWIPFHAIGKWPAIIATQIQKRNPVNIRPILGIKKELNPKAAGLFLQAFSILYKKTGSIEYKNIADRLFSLILSVSSEGYSGYCWGYNFPWVSKEKYLKAYTPSSVVTGFICKGLLAYYEATGNKDAPIIIESASRFIINDLPQYNDETGTCISYTPVKKDICYNASLLAGEVLAIGSHLKLNSYKELCSKLIDFVISRQKDNGAWFYSEQIENGIERQQIDFHQGYILESIYNIKNLLNIKHKNWENAISKGLEYYSENQFLPDGRAIWRVPKQYPVEIHNQSQGIITFNRLSEYENNYKNLSEKILNWTIQNMQGNSGAFYYQKHKLLTNRTSYMRWNQAWMFLALSDYLYN